MNRLSVAVFSKISSVNFLLLYKVVITTNFDDAIEQVRARGWCAASWLPEVVALAAETGAAVAAEAVPEP